MIGIFIMIPYVHRGNQSKHMEIVDDIAAVIYRTRYNESPRNEQQEKRCREEWISGWGTTNILAKIKKYAVRHCFCNVVRSR